MCGICGVVERRAPVDRAALAAMVETLRHRGPDDEGSLISDGGDRGPSAGLGFRRLAIIDLTTGNQPIANEDGSIHVVLNGEIYNHRELRRELEGRGHRFATDSDVEVVVHLYEERGTGCLDALNGMFALALWDERRRTLFAARDRLGKKPFYYAADDERLLFGSELKALLAHPACPRGIDHESLGRYLALEYVPAPDTIFGGVRKLPAGHFLTLSEGRLRVERYWDLTFEAEAPRREDEVVEEFGARLSEAVRIRLEADVPLGAFLSGGIDSSSVVAMMARHLPPERIKTFSIGFAESSFDESTHARRVARHFRTDHHEEIFAASRVLDLLPEVAETLDEPLGDPSYLPAYLLAKFTREHVTVALGGDGGDELLAGYPTFQADALARFYRVPQWLHGRMILPLAERLPVSTDNISLDFKVKRFLAGMSYPPATRHAAWLGSFTPEEQAALLVRSSGDPYDRLRAAYHEAPSDRRLDRLIYTYVKTYLQDDILVKVDRSSMACSLEVRAPFLDYTLVEFLGRVPRSLKQRGLDTKVLLKRAMAGRLPPGIADRRKKGFGIPIAEWFKGDLREALLDELSPARLARQGLFRPAEVERLIRDHLGGRRDNRKQLWTLFVFQLWYERYVTSPAWRTPAGAARSR